MVCCTRGCHYVTNNGRYACVWSGSTAQTFPSLKKIYGRNEFVLFAAFEHKKCSSSEMENL